MNLVNIDFINPIMKKCQLPEQPKETEIGNKEYKRKILFTKNHNKMIEKRRTQMLYRLYEGNGIAYYFLGVEDNGQPHGISLSELLITIQNLKEISDGLNTEWKYIEIYPGITRNSYTAIVQLTLTNITSYSIY